MLPIIHPLHDKIDFLLLIKQDEEYGGWFVLQDFQIILADYSFNTIETNFWKTEGNTITVKRPYFWDGTSFPGLNEDDGAIASLIHDILCTKVNGEYPASYYTKHVLYKNIAIKQDMNCIKAYVIFGVLICFNWIYLKVKRALLSQTSIQLLQANPKSP